MSQMWQTQTHHECTMKIHEIDRSSGKPRFVPSFFVVMPVEDTNPRQEEAIQEAIHESTLVRSTPLNNEKLMTTV